MFQSLRRNHACQVESVRASKSAHARGAEGGDRPSHIMDVDEDQNLGIYSNRGLSSVLVINKHLSHQRGGEGEERET